MAKKKLNIKDLSKTLKFAGFLTTYTDINPSGGINHRINGKGTGANSKTKELTPEDKASLCKGLRLYVNDIESVIKSLEDGKV